MADGFRERRREAEGSRVGPFPPPVAVVFDLGGVLVDWDPRYLYRKLFPDETAVERFLAEVCSPAWNVEQDRGRPWAEAVALLQAQHPGFASEIAAYYERWPEMLRGPIAGSVALLEALAGQELPLYALSNWSTETFRFARERFGFLACFRAVVISGDVGLVKPEPAIFELMADRYRLPPARTLFVDDAEANVTAARGCGFDAVLFRSPAALEADLRARGLLSGESPAMHAER